MLQKHDKHDICICLSFLIHICICICIFICICVCICIVFVFVQTLLPYCGRIGRPSHNYTYQPHCIGRCKNITRLIFDDDDDIELDCHVFCICMLTDKRKISTINAMMRMMMIGHCGIIIRLIFARNTPSAIAHALHLPWWGIFIAVRMQGRAEEKVGRSIV